eukprot:33306-Eustigmatos_ZCMA.PRE.1
MRRSHTSIQPQWFHIYTRRGTEQVLISSFIIRFALYDDLCCVRFHQGISSPPLELREPPVHFHHRYNRPIA